MRKNALKGNASNRYGVGAPPTHLLWRTLILAQLPPCNMAVGRP